MKKILIATSNKGKFEEYKSYLYPMGFVPVSLEEEGINFTPEEVGKTYLEIARNKAKEYSKYTKLPVVAEDSGLEIYVFWDFPGVYSDRWMVGTSDQKNEAILEKMKGIEYRRATFRVVVVYLHKKEFVHFEGEMSGEISNTAEGVKGSGYGRIFYIPEKKRTLAQILIFEKNKISHRGKAIQKLASYLKRYKPPA